MIKHIVMMRLEEADATEKQLQLKNIKLQLEALSGVIPSLKAMEVGLNFSDRDTAFDLVLVSLFDDDAGLEAYRIHSAHVKVLDYLKGKLETTAVTDYLL